MKTPPYARARDWIAKNMNTNDYVTFERFLRDVKKKPGFNKIGDMDNFIDGIKGRKSFDRYNFEGEYIFKTDDQKKAYEKKLKARVKELQKTIKASEAATKKSDIDRLFSKPAEQAGGFVKKTVNAVKGFFKGLFGGKK